MHSLPEPLFVPSTPSKSHLETMETWNMAKLLGVKSSNEEAVFGVEKVEEIDGFGGEQPFRVIQEETKN